MKIDCLEYEGEGKRCLHLMKEVDKGLCTLPGHFACPEWDKRHGKGVKVDYTNFSMSYSRGRSWAKCRRLYHYEYRLGLQLKPEYQSIPLRLGSLASKYLGYIHSESKSGLKPMSESLQDALQGVEDVKRTPFMALEVLMSEYQYMDVCNIKGEAEKEGVWQEEGFPRVHGFLDLAEHGSTEDVPIWGWEFKYSGRMSNWSKFVLTPQLSTYFLCFPTMPRVTVRVFRNPDLRKGAKEGIEEFLARLRTDIKRRPKYYIEDMVYWREEFDLIGWKNQLKAIHRDILKAEEEDSFYSNQTACFSPWQCDYYPICSTDGLIPENMYQNKPKREGANDNTGV